MYKKWLQVIAVSLVILFAAFLRVSTFYLPHNHGDQLIYLGLAMKLDKFGLADYNLRRLDIIGNEDFIGVVTAKEEKGSMLRRFEADNLFYYSREVLDSRPPAFSYLLMLSHKIFSPEGMFFTVNRNLGPKALFYHPAKFFKVQFYAAWINFVFSLLAVGMVFLLARVLFNQRVGLWAAILMAISPLDILTSQRLWADEMLVFFTALAVFLFWKARKTQSMTFAILSGVSAGIAALTKGTGLFIIGGILLFTMCVNLKQNYKGLLSIKNIFDREQMIFLFFALAISFFWYARVTITYGTPLYRPHIASFDKLGSWDFKMNQRLRYGQAYYFVFLTPAYILFYFELVKTMLRKVFSQERLILLCWFFVFLIPLVYLKANEERYMLPAYPAIAIFTALALESIRCKANLLLKVKYLGDVIVLMVFVSTFFWSCALSLKYVFGNSPIFNIF